MTIPTVSTTYRKPEVPRVKRITCHDVLCLAQSLEAQGKGRIAKELKPVAYQIMADDRRFAILREQIANNAAPAELLKTIDVAMGRE